MDISKIFRNIAKVILIMYGLLFAFLWFVDDFSFHEVIENAIPIMAMVFILLKNRDHKKYNDRKKQNHNQINKK